MMQRLAIGLVFVVGCGSGTVGGDPDGGVAPGEDGGGPPVPADSGPAPDGEVVEPGDVPAFHSPAVPVGQIDVRLVPTEVVTPGVSTLVTFGVPFPRGSLSEDELSTVRVLVGGVEVPAYVGMMTPWRHMNDGAVDGASVRVARIQLWHEFSSLEPDTIVVEWGGEARVQSIGTLTDPRTAWHRVNSDTFPAEYNVDEPDVYAVLPAEWMARGLLLPARSLPFAAEVSEERSDPAETDAIEHWPGYSELDHAAKNFFYTAINRDDEAVAAENECPYLEDSEPWLYDRAATFFRLYFRSGFPVVLQEAVRSAEFYRDRLYPPGTVPGDAVGAFRLKNPDPAGYIGANGVMYSYAESLAYAAWVTGDDEMLDSIRWVVAAHQAQEDGEPMRWSPDASGWTERHTAFRLLAHVVAYEVFGEEAATIDEWIGDLAWHQDGAGGLLPDERVDGALWHEMGQHEGEDGPLMASPWMTALTVDALVRAYAFSEDPRIAELVRRIGTFELAATRRMEPFEYEYEEGDGLLRLVDYITFIDGSVYEPEGSTGEHALEVAATAAWAHYFAELSGNPDPALRQMADELYLTHDIAVNYWTRPTAPAEAGLPAYRLQVGVCRKYGWQYRPAASLSWLLAD